MLSNQVVYNKNGFGSGNSLSVDWNLSITMMTRIMLVSMEGDVLDTVFHEKLLSLFECATQMSVTTNALIFHLPLSLVQLHAFMTEHAMNHTVVSDMDTDILPTIIPNKEIISILTDPVNINMFHMMMELETDDITEFIDMELCVDVMDIL
jgi:hypothetical protein